MLFNLFAKICFYHVCFASKSIGYMQKSEVFIKKTFKTVSFSLLSSQKHLVLFSTSQTSLPSGILWALKPHVADFLHAADDVNSLWVRVLEPCGGSVPALNLR